MFLQMWRPKPVTIPEVKDVLEGYAKVGYSVDHLLRISLEVVDRHLRQAQLNASQAQERVRALETLRDEYQKAIDSRTGA